MKRLLWLVPVAIATVLPSARASPPIWRDPPARSSWTVRMEPVPWTIVRTCKTLQRRVRWRVLCPAFLPRPVLGGLPSFPPGAIVATWNRDGLDIGYGAHWEGPGSGIHLWRNRPSCFLHFVVGRAFHGVPSDARPARLGGIAGRLAPASGRYWEGPYFGNHVRFFFRRGRTSYVATLHTFGERATEALLGRILRSLRPARAVRTSFRPPPGSLTVATGSLATQSLAVANGRLWAASTGAYPAAGSIVGLDPDGRVRARIAVRPRDLAVAGGSLWAAVHVGNRTDVVRLDHRGRKLARIRTGQFPRAVAAGEGAVWVVNGAPLFKRGGLVRVDAARNRITGRTPLGAGPTEAAVGAGAVWVTDAIDGTLTRVDPETMRVAARIRVSPYPYGVAVAAGSVWVTHADDGLVSRVDPATNRIMARIRVGANPYGIAADGRAAWVADQGTGAVYRIDARTNRIRAIWLGGEPFAVALTPTAAWIGRGEGTVTRLPNA